MVVLHYTCTGLRQHCTALYMSWITSALYCIIHVLDHIGVVLHYTCTGSRQHCATPPDGSSILRHHLAVAAFCDTTWR